MSQGLNSFFLSRASTISKRLTLEKKIANTTQSRVMRLSKKFQTLKKVNTSISEYLLHAKTISNHLDSTNEIKP